MDKALILNTINLRFWKKCSSLQNIWFSGVFGFWDSRYGVCLNTANRTVHWSECCYWVANIKI